MALESRMANTCRTKRDDGSVEAAVLSSTTSRSSARPSGKRQRQPRPLGAAAAAMAMALFTVGSLQRIEMAAATGFGYGDPIDVLVTAGDEIVLQFEGEEADAVAVSIQQCTGNSYVRMGVFYNTDDELTSGNRLEGSQCVRIKADFSSDDSSADDYNRLCAFKNSGPVELMYSENTLNTSNTYTNSTNTSPMVDPSEIQVVISNTGTTTATVQVVLFSNDFPAPGAGSSIDRVHTKSDQDENTYTVDASFQAEGSTDPFCDEGVCSVYAYYIKIDDNDSDADLLFGTTCQARTGVMVYEGSTTIASTSLVGESGDGDGQDDDVETAAAGAATGATGATTLSTTPYDVLACTEFPKNTEGLYRVYLVVSPDTSTASTVGYGLRDQLLYESEEIRVEDDMDALCPEIQGEDTSGAARTIFAAAPGGAAAASAAVFGVVALLLVRW